MRNSHRIKYEEAWILGIRDDPEMDEFERDQHYKYGAFGHFVDSLRCYFNEAESKRIFEVYSRLVPAPTEVVSLIY